MISPTLAQEFLPNTTRSSLETHWRTANEAALAIIDGLDRMSYLHLQYARAGIAEAALTARHFLEADGAGTWRSTASAGLHPNVEQAVSYTRHAAGIVASVQANLASIAQAQLGEFNGFTQSLLEDLARNLPGSPGNPWGVMRMVFQNASSGYEQLCRAAQQASGVLEGQLGTVEPAPFKSACQGRLSDVAAIGAAACQPSLDKSALQEEAN